MGIFKGTYFGLNSFIMKGADLWIAQNILIYGFVGHFVKNVISFCLNDDEFSCVYCFKFHPVSLVSLVKLIPDYYRAFIRFRRDSPLYINGSPQAFILLPVILLFRKKYIVLELGSWPDVVYWDLTHYFGPAFAKTLKFFTIVSRYVVWIFSKCFITNSISVYKTFRGRKIVYKIQRVKIPRSLCGKNFQNRTGILVPIRLNPHKGILRAINAFIKSRNTNQPIYIVGDGPLRNIVTKICKLSHNNKIIYLGTIPRRELLELMKKVKIVVIPSYTEGFPNVLIEALKCKVPIIIVMSDLDLSRYINNWEINSSKVYISKNSEELSIILKKLSNEFNVREYRYDRNSFK